MFLMMAEKGHSLRRAGHHDRLADRGDRAPVRLESQGPLNRLRPRQLYLA
jgi:hypothetical protein